VKIQIPDRMRPRLSRRWLSIVALANLVALLAPNPVAAAEPAGFEYYHTYAENKAFIDSTVAAHPGIARRFNIGRSYQGRKIWGIKISDNATTDENEPEIFVNAEIHARERATNELALNMIATLTDNYGGSDALSQRVTDIVNSREIWIVPMVNVDGAEFDISGGRWHRWRKNRQPIPGSTEIGIDLNRQFGYMWNCCGGSSSNPASDTYHGPSAWYAPEARRYRNFVNSRVVGGQQQIKVLLSLHSAGGLVLWPYSYTKADVPPEMPQDDHDAFVALGRDLAALNGYKPEQGSDLYIVDGDQDDWAYHEHGIFTYTFEMRRGALKRYYPTQSELATDINNNRPAVLELLEQADCPYRAAGLAATHC
jgi:carboxypeptidase T